MCIRDRVWEDGRAQQIPAYQTDSVWPIGSGDVFAAVFAARWTGQDFSAVHAAVHASRAAALYCNNRVLPITSDELEPGDKFPFRMLSIKMCIRDSHRSTHYQFALRRTKRTLEI